MLVLAMTAERFHCLPHELLELTPLELDFAITCNYRLMLNDLERQQKELEAAEGGETDKGGIPKGKITKDTVRW